MAQTTISTEAPEAVELTEEEREKWLEIVEELRERPKFWSWLREVHPKGYDDLSQAIRSLHRMALQATWRHSARPEQLLPGTPGSFSDRTDWRTWLLMGGRGSGKSRAAAEAIRELILSRDWSIAPRIALVSTTLDAVRVDMVEGQLLDVLGDEVVKYNRGTVEIFCRNGAYLKGYSSERPRRLRGPNFVAAWADEPANWMDADLAPSEDSTWSNLEFATRLDDGKTWVPRIIATTTPKPVRLLRVRDENDEHYPGLVDDEGTVVCHLRSADNLDNLAEIFKRRVIARYKGTRLGRQELEGMLLDAAEGAMWSPELISAHRGTIRTLNQASGMGRIIISVDPSVGDGSADECGIVVMCANQVGDQAWVLEDASMRGKPKEWASRVYELFQTYKADCVVAEVNHGFEMVRETLQREDANIPIRSVVAKRGKMARAEPVSLLTEQHQIWWMGDFPLLEGQLTTWEPTSGKGSPDRLDAFVQGALHLLPIYGSVGEMYSDYGSGFESTR